MTEKSTPPEVIKDVMNTVSDQIEGIGSEIGEQVQALFRETNNRHLAVRDTSGRVLLQVPLTVGLVGGISFFLLVPIRKATLLMIAALFAGISFSVEDNDEMATVTTRKTRRQA